MNLIVILIGKVIMSLLKVTGRSGTALPGLIAERLHPRLMADMLSKLPNGTVVVTGTNGKTTTTKILCELLESQGLRVVSNPSGSNFTRGIYAALIRQASWTGKLDGDIGVFELDEAYSRIFAAQVKPKLVLALNVLRDQLDRYGEIDTTAQHIGEAISHAQGAVLNADDPPVAGLATHLDHLGEATYFGVAAPLRDKLPTDEELHGQSEVGQESTPDKMVTLTKARMRGGQEKIAFRIKGEEYAAHFPLEGVHNAQNAVAALTTTLRLVPEANPEKLAEALSRIHPAFGRGEQLLIQDRKVHIALVKNPGGFNQNLRAFVRKEMGVILILINDNYADSRDTSWLWDVDFSELKLHNTKVMVGGIRAHDMALRLQYDNIAVDSIIEDVEQALAQAINTGDKSKDVLIFPTYTAMIETRGIFEKQGIVEGIW